jgi:hypothetical protein
MGEPKYYRMAQEKHDKGARFTGQNEYPLTSSGYEDVEKILEGRRPNNCFARSESVYMRDDRDFAKLGIPYEKGFIHEVDPLGKLEKRDLAWIGVLQGRYPKTKRYVADPCQEITDSEIADMYWSGKATENPVWEWIARDAVVVHVDELATNVRPPSPFLDVFRNE